MLLRRSFVVLALVGSLAACGTGPVKRIHPSTASIQQLAVQADGSWKITLRIQNFSTVPMTYREVTAKLSIGGNEVGELHAAPDIDIIANSGDVVETTLRPSAPLPAGNDFEYHLKGTIATSEPKANFPFERTSRLSPVPGVPNTYR
ncbi:MAG: hypothetical protein GXC76_16510 [Rhodanobacteraceae bacterium]|jgi:hypothetical protein|nr:hypothetical protein [Rhodanobacteraceae bacterium]